MNLVNPYVYEKSITPVLDLYSGAKVAYSLRKVRTAYTGKCIRVRRSSDNTEVDIDFKSNGKLDDVSLLSFVGGGNGYIVKWYDQSGNGLDAAQTVNANQPRIVLAGVIETNGGDMSIRFDQSLSPFLRVTPFSFTQASVFASVSVLGGSNNSRLFAMSPVGATDVGSPSECFTFSVSTIRSNFRAINTGTSLTVTDQIISQIVSSTAANMYRNGASITSDLAITPSLCNPPRISISFSGDLAQNGTAIDYLNGYMKELIFYNSDQTSNRTGIEGNMNSYYKIY